MKLRVKDDSVNVHGLQPEMQPVLKHSAAVWAEAGFPHVVTSGRDGLHSPASMHYYGYAVDLRTWDAHGNQLSRQQKQQLADTLRARLRRHSPLYDIVIHDTHIHVEYDWTRAES